MNLAIRVEDLSKRYSLGEGSGEPYHTLRESITKAGIGCWRWLRRRVPGAEPQARAARQPGKDFWALREVSFDVAPGEVVGIVGRNGAGKSTLLKVLTRITEPTRGRVEIRGRMASLLEVGTGFHPELTGRENIFLNGAILGMSRREMRHKFDEIVAFAEVEKFLDTPVKRYSSGMYVRLAFAVAAHLEPEILLIDEVLAVGDAAFQKKCLGRMESVANEGRTVFFVSHNMAAVAQLCTKAVWLEAGRVREIGSADVVVRDYLAAGQAQIAERNWSWPGDAPGDSRVRLLGLRALQDDRAAPIVDINRPLEIEFEFAVLKPARNLISGVNFYDAHGVCLFGTADWRENTLTPGTYRKQLALPAHFLAEGQVRILAQLVFYDPDVRSAVIPDALLLEAIETDHPLAVRGLYKGTWPGVVRPRLPWSDAQPVL